MKLAINSLIIVAVIILQSAASPAADNWYDTFYQYRVPVVVAADEAGWQVVPITPLAITDAVNSIEEMKFDPLWFDYNNLKAVEVDGEGNVIGAESSAGFYLIPEGKELATEKLSGEKQKITIPTEKDGYYLVSFVNEGAGYPPTTDYEQVFEIGTPPRKHAYRTSYLPRPLEKKEKTYECLMRSDGQPMSLNVKSRFVTGLKSISVKKVNIVLLANFKKPGKRYWMLYYQPVNGHHLVIPKLRRNEMPEVLAKVLRVGLAQKYAVNTRYRLNSNDDFDAWFAETTVKLTPNTAAPSNSSEAIKISSAKNEKQSFQIVLKPKRPFNFNGITAGALKDGKNKIAASNISFYALDYVPISRKSPITPVEYKGMMADPLVAVEAKQLSPMDGNHGLWVTVNTPAGTPAGTYQGSITVEGSLAMSIPIELEVYDFELPEFSPFRTSWGGSHFTKPYPGTRDVPDYHGISSKKDVKKLVRKYYDMMAANKCLPHNVTQYSKIGMNWSPPPEGYNVDKPGNYFKLYDWDFTEFNRDLEHYVNDMKVNAFTLVHTNPSVIQRFKHLPGKEVTPYRRNAGHISLEWQTFREETIVGYNKLEKDTFIEITRDQYDRLLLDFYGTIAKNLEEHGWLDYSCILVDETHYRGFDEFLHFLRLLKSDPLTARIQVMWTIQSPDAFTYKENPDDEEYAFNGLIDIYMPEAQENYQRWEKYFFTDYDIEPGREKLWTYVTHTTRVAIDSPGINNRAFALDVFNAGGSGYLCWASFMWDKAGTGNETDSPWLYPWTRWANGAMSYFYPPRKDGPSPEPDWTIVPSLRLMTFREGVDDYEYAYMLEQLIAEAEKKGLDVTESKRVIGEIEKFFYSTIHWSQNDAWYLELRDRMAREIVKLQRELR